MLSNRRIKNFLIVIFLTLVLVVATTFLSSEVQNQPLYQVIKVVIEKKTGISTDSILSPSASSVTTSVPTPDSSLNKDSSSPSSETATTSAQFAVIKKVIDGDTVELETGEKLRYIGINTPETQHPQKGKECFGSESTAANKNLVEGKTVRLEKDVSEVDRYGRLLRYVWVDDTLVNESLVLDGFAHSSSYPPDIKYQDLFMIAEQKARENKKGLWSACPLAQP